MSIISDAENFLWRIAITKGIQRGIQALILLLAAKAGALGHYGVGINIDQAAAVAAAAAAAETARNWLKQKTGWAWL